MKQIELTKGMFAFVDDEDFEAMNKISWHYQPRRKTGYAIAQETIDGKQTTIRMHRLILKAKHGEIVDHINGNGLDNTRSNLRIVDHRINAINRRSVPQSGYKGVTKRRSARGKTDYWISRIGPKENHRTIGCFKTPEEAAHEYDREAKKLYGKNAVTNFRQEK